jgi:hypothetical protein
MTAAAFVANSLIPITPVPFIPFQVFTHFLQIDLFSAALKR